MRIGLVLGAGAFPGYGFHIGVLQAMQDVLGVDARDAQVVVGTSIGAVTAGVLRGGFQVDDLAAELDGTPMTTEGHALLWDRCDPPGELPPDFGALKLPRPGINGLGGIRALTDRHDTRSMWSRIPNAAAGLLPVGRSSLAAISDSLDVLHGHAWPVRDMWTVTVRQSDGQRVVFGRDDAPRVTPGVGCTASASIPGVFAPMEVDGEQHVDAGICSTTNADLLAERDDLDLIVISAPLAGARRVSMSIDAPMRMLANAQIRAESAVLRDAGHRVVTLAPSSSAARGMGFSPLADDRAAQSAVRATARAEARETLLGLGFPRVMSAPARVHTTLAA